MSIIKFSSEKKFKKENIRNQYFKRNTNSRGKSLKATILKAN